VRAVDQRLETTPHPAVQPVDEALIGGRPREARRSGEQGDLAEEQVRLLGDDPEALAPLVQGYAAYQGLTPEEARQ
jgi:hypothetical protein